MPALLKAQSNQIPLSFSGKRKRGLTATERAAKALLDSGRSHTIVDPHLVSRLGELAKRPNISTTVRTRVSNTLKQYAKAVASTNWGSHGRRLQPLLDINDGDDTYYLASEHRIEIGIQPPKVSAIPHEIKHAKVAVNNTRVALKDPKNFARILTRSYLSDPLGSQLQRGKHDHNAHLKGKKNIAFILHESLKYILDPNSGITSSTSPIELMNTFSSKLRPKLAKKNLNLDDPNVNYSLKFMLFYAATAVIPVSILFGKELKARSYAGNNDTDILKKRIQKFTEKPMTPEQMAKKLRNVGINSLNTLWMQRRDISEDLLDFIHCTIPEETLAINAETKAIRVHIKQHYPHIQAHLDKLGATPLTQVPIRSFDNVYGSKLEQEFIKDLYELQHSATVLPLLRQLAKLHRRAEKAKLAGQAQPPDVPEAVHHLREHLLAEVDTYRRNVGKNGMTSAISGGLQLFGLSLA